MNVDVLDAEAITKGKHHAQLSMQHADFKDKKGHFLKVCMKINVQQLHEIVDITSKQIVRACINCRVSQRGLHLIHSI